MARGSGLRLRLSADAVPLLSRAAAFAEGGYITGASHRNWASYGEEVNLPDGFPDWRRLLLADPQTSGGLLVAVAPERLLAVCTERMRSLERQERYVDFAAFFADWPPADLVGLFAFLKKRGSRLGGNTGQYFLRFLGKDAFIFSRDVCAALVREGVVDKPPTSKRDMAKAQAAFTHWHEESGRPYCQISQILAFSIDG